MTVIMRMYLINQREKVIALWIENIRELINGINVS